MQSKKHSLFESLANTFIGLVTAFITQLIIFPLFNIHIKLIDNFFILIIFTSVSIVRSYAVRRFFNYLHVRSSNV
jgi:hypothetical protein